MIFLTGWGFVGWLGSVPADIGQTNREYAVDDEDFTAPQVGLARVQVHIFSRRSGQRHNAAYLQLEQFPKRDGFASQLRPQGERNVLYHFQAFHLLIDVLIVGGTAQANQPFFFQFPRDGNGLLLGRIDVFQAHRSEI